MNAGLGDWTSVVRHRRSDRPEVQYVLVWIKRQSEQWTSARVALSSGSSAT